MANGPSLQNLSSYQPSRDIFADATGIARNFNAGLGDANLSTALDVVEGIDKGLDLATKANTFIESISPRAEEEKRLNLEIKRAQNSVMQQAGQAAQIQMQKDALTKENDLLKAKNTAAYDAILAKTQLEQGILAEKAANALSQVADPASFLSVVQDPQYSTLNTFEPYKNAIGNKAQSMLGRTTDPVEQTKLLQVMESAKPGSAKAQLPFLSQEVQKLFLSPTDLADLELKRDQGKKAAAEATKAQAEAGQITDASKAQAAAAAQPENDPIRDALAAAGFPVQQPQAAPVTPQPQAGGATQPQAPGSSTVGAPNQPGGPITQPGTAPQPASNVGAPGQPPKEAPDPSLTPEQQKIYDNTQSQIYLDDLKKNWLEKFNATPGLPGDKKRKALMKQSIRDFPDMPYPQRVAYVEDQAKSTDLSTDQSKEISKARETVNNFDVSTLRMQAALNGIDKYIKEHGDANLGTADKIDRAAMLAHARTLGLNKEEKDLISYWDELDAQGVRNALVDLSTMKLGNAVLLANTPGEMEAQQKMHTGSNISYERNRQAADIMIAKGDQAKGMLSIVDGLLQMNYGYENASRVGDGWRHANNPLEVSQVNGVRVVQRKSVEQQKKLQTPSEYLFKTMNLDRYLQRTPEGRVIPSKPVDIHNFSSQLSDKISQGQPLTPPKKADIADKMYEASDALVTAVVLQEAQKRGAPIGVVDPIAVSSAGAKGPFQLMDITGKDLWEKKFKFPGAYNPFDIPKNVAMGISYLNTQLKDFNGDTRLALAAYNAGPTKVQNIIDAYNSAEENLGRTDYAAVSHYLPDETKNYVKKIMGDGKPLERGSPTSLEYRGAFSSLPSQKAQSYAQSNLTSDGVAALEETNNIKTVSETKGTILEPVVGALLSPDPYGESDIGPNTEANKNLKSNSAGLYEGEDPGAGRENSNIPVFTGSADDENAGRKVVKDDPSYINWIKQNNPLRGPDTASAQTVEETGPAAAPTRNLNADGSVSTEGVDSGNPLGLEIFGSADQDLNTLGLTETARKILNSTPEARLQFQQGLRKHIEEYDSSESLTPEQKLLRETANSVLKKLDAYRPSGSEDLYYKESDTAQPSTQPSKEQRNPESPLLFAKLSELNPFRGAETAEADTGIQVSPWENTGNKPMATPQQKYMWGNEERTVDSSPLAASDSFAMPDDSGYSDEFQAVIMGAARGLLFGGDDEVFALGRMAVHGETWEQATAQTRAIRDTLQKAHPGLYMIGDLAGGIANPIPTKLFKGIKSLYNYGKAVKPVTKVRKVIEAEKLGSTVTKTVGKSAAIGAAAGGWTGFLEGEAGVSGEELDNRLKRGLKGLVWGGVAGTVLGPLVHKLAKGSSAFTKEEQAILKKMDGLSDADLQRYIDELTDAGNPAGSILQKLGVKRIKPYVNLAARDTNVAASVVTQAEENLGGQFDRVVASVGQTKTSSEAAKDFSEVVQKKVGDFYTERSDIGDKVYATARASASKNTIQSKAKFQKLRIAKESEKNAVVGKTAAGQDITATIPKFRKKEIVPSVDRPAFTSDRVAEVAKDPFIEDAILRAKREVDPNDLLEANDFAVLQHADSMLGYESTLGGTTAKLKGDAHRKLQSALSDENPDYGPAVAAYKKANEVLDKKYSAGMQHLEKYAAPGGKLDIRKINDDLFKLGPTEIKAIINELSPAEHSALKEAARAHITDAVKNRRPKKVTDKISEFPDLLKNGGEEKIRAIFDPAEATKYIKSLHDESEISAVAKRLIDAVPAAKEAAEKEGKQLAELSKSDQTRFAASIGMMPIWGLNMYTGTVSTALGLKALRSYIKSGKYANEEQLAQGIADRLYLEPKLGLEFLEKISSHVAKESSEWSPTWNRVVATTAQIIVSGGNDGEPQTTARENKDAADRIDKALSSTSSQYDLEQEKINSQLKSK